MIAFAVLFAILICFFPSFGPIDDHVFLEPYLPLRFLAGDRFFPLDGIEQFAVLKIFGFSPFPFYLVNALEFFCLFFILFAIAKKTSTSLTFAKWLPVLAAFTPGITSAYFRLLVPERLLVLCLSVIALLDLEPLRNNFKKCIYLFAVLVAFFLKEPAFLIIGGISFFHFIRKEERVFHLGVMLLCVGYLGLYLFVTRNALGDQHYGASSIRGFTLFARNIFNFILNDPLVVLFAIPLWFITFFRTRKFDPHLTIIVGYFFMFIVLGIFQEYYLLPILPFLVASVGRYWNTFQKPVRYALGILVLNSTLFGLAQISLYKNEPRGFIQTITRLAEEPAMAGKTVCYLGLNTEFSTEILVASTKFFESFRPNEAGPEFKSGSGCDYEIDSPFNYEGAALNEKSDVLLHYRPVLRFPAVSLKNWIKYFAMQSDSAKLVNKNIFRKHDFVLMKRNF